MKKFLFIFPLLNIFTFGQPNNPNILPKPEFPFQSEIISFQTVEEDFSINYIYKIPYKILVFEREGNSYKANFRVIVEVTDNDSKLISREIKDNNISVENFEATSEPDLLLQDCINFRLNVGEYKITAIISDLNSTGELRLDQDELNLTEIQTKNVLSPLLIKSREINCNDSKAFILSNTGGKIPFSSESYHLVLPVTDTSIQDLEVEILNNDEQIFSGAVNESYIMNLGISGCDENVVLTSSSINTACKYFIIRNLNDRLKEGELVLSIKNEVNSIDEEYNLRVIWFGKPFSLSNPEKALELLSYVEPDSVVSRLLDSKSSDYLKVLNEHWHKFDPTPSTNYNEIMFEYYNRIDYAIQEFKGLNKENGARSDRGMIYIRYGNPEKIERSSNPQGFVLETWTYQNPERKFTFIDKKGTGNFTLIDD